MALALVSPTEAIKGPIKAVESFPVDPALLAEMQAVMTANQGIGLAAPQVGVKLALFIFDMGNGLRVVCNPLLENLSDKAIQHVEGCLSLPGKKVIVPRWFSVRLSAQDANGEPFVWNLKWDISYVVQHEVSHLLGKLIDDSEWGIRGIKP